MTVSGPAKGTLHFLKGRALNISPDYDAKAEESLGKATKFNLSDAWNELGECLLKKGDSQAAKNCFLKALEKVLCLSYHLFALLISSTRDPAGVFLPIMSPRNVV